MKKALTLIVVIVAAFSFTACNTGTGEETGLVQHQFPIIGGDLPNAPMHDAVVSLHQREGDSWYPNIFCSGTLIAPDVILTAAHCLDVGNRKKVVTMNPSALVIYLGNNPVTDNNPELHLVTETLIHPNYNKTQLTNDIGLVRLNSASNVTPVPALPASLGFNAGDEGSLTLNFAGFGADENNNYDTKLQVDGTLDSLYSASQIYYTQADSGPCFGDSGGPAFLYRNNTAYVGGMTSFGDEYCSQYGVSTRADFFEDFIKDFVGTVDPGPDCSADGLCNPECADDPDCTPGPDCSADGSCNPECADDPDCIPDPDPTCGSRGDSCDSGADCCSGRCHAKKHTCN